MTRWSDVRSGIAAAMLCATSTLHAEPAVPESLEYGAPPECPNAGAFSAQVAARTALWGRLRPGLKVRVRIDGVDGAWRGVLALADEHGSTVREVRGERCSDVAQALALIVAILVDPDADTRSLSPSAPPDRSERAPFAGEIPPATPRREAPPTRWVFSGGAQLTATTGVADAVLVGERWFVTLEHAGGDPSLGLRLAVGRDASGTIEHGGSTSSAISRRLARFDACAAVSSSPPLAFSLCGFGEAGRLEAMGRHPVAPETQALGWVSVGALFRAGVRYRGVLGVEAELDAGLPLTRYRFRFGDETLYETSPLVIGTALGLSAHFP